MNRSRLRNTNFSLTPFRKANGDRYNKLERKPVTCSKLFWKSVTPLFLERYFIARAHRTFFIQLTLS